MGQTQFKIAYPELAVNYAGCYCITGVSGAT